MELSQSFTIRILIISSLWAFFLVNISVTLFHVKFNFSNKDSLLFQLVAMNIYQKQLTRGVPWNQLKSENIEILYLLSTLKEPVQINNKKSSMLCYGAMEQAWRSKLCQHIYYPISWQWSISIPQVFLYVFFFFFLYNNDFPQK